MGEIAPSNGKTSIGCDVVYKCTAETSNKGEIPLADSKGCPTHHAGLADLACEEAAGLVGLIIVMWTDKPIW